MIHPLRDNILIEIHKIAENAMLMVDENESKIEKATVLDIGSEVELVRPGDEIIFKNYELDTIEIEGQKYNFISEESVKAICTPATTEK